MISNSQDNLAFLNIIKILDQQPLNTKRHRIFDSLELDSSSLSNENKSLSVTSEKNMFQSRKFELDINNLNALNDVIHILQFFTATQNNPNVIHLSQFDFKIDLVNQKIEFIFLTELPGTSLEQKIIENSFTETSKLISLVKTLIPIVAYLELPHGALKPENVYIDDGGLIQLDYPNTFQLNKSDSQSIYTAHEETTPLQISDIFAVGVILLRAALGNKYTVDKSTLETNFTILSQICESQSIVGILKGALEKDSNKRKNYKAQFHRFMVEHLSLSSPKNINLSDLMNTKRDQKLFSRSHTTPIIDDSLESISSPTANPNQILKMKREIEELKMLVTSLSRQNEDLTKKILIMIKRRF